MIDEGPLINVSFPGIRNCAVHHATQKSDTNKVTSNSEMSPVNETQKHLYHSSTKKRKSFQLVFKKSTDIVSQNFSRPLHSKIFQDC